MVKAPILVRLKQHKQLVISVKTVLEIMALVASRGGAPKECGNVCI